MSELKVYVCTKQLSLATYDDEGFVIENEYYTVEVGEVFEKSECPYRMIGGSDTVRLESATRWIEITEDTFKKHFALKQQKGR